MKENRFNPEDLIRDIHACTPVYLERLLGRHALFVPGDGSVSMEALYKADNFMNLCGVHYENISPNHVRAKKRHIQNLHADRIEQLNKYLT